MPVTSGTVMIQAANHLNDGSQLVYTSAVLLPFLNMAIQELDEELAVFELSPMRRDSIVIDVLTGSPLLAEMPTDFVEAITLYERTKGSSDVFREIREVAKVDINYTGYPDTIISEWTVRGAQILVNPPSTDREVMLDYVAGFVEAAGTGTALDIESSRRFLALLTARNAARDLGNSPSKADSYKTDIDRARDRLVRRLQKNSQDTLGVRRLPYTGRGY